MLSDYFDILRRRKWSMMLPAFAVFLIAGAVAVLLPSYYKSTSTILIEEQEIPADFVMDTVTSYAEKRLQSITQQVMSTSRLLEMLERFNLYADLKGKWSTEEIIEKMRKDIKFGTISADVVDQRTGRPTTATIAFTLSYVGKSPDKVLKVATMLASLYLEENLRVRKRQTKEASVFLEDEMEKVKSDMSEIEGKISKFKEQHTNELPELMQVSMQTLNNVERNIERLEEQLRSLKEREGYLQTQLVSIPPELNQDRRRLDYLEIQLMNLRSQFSEEYPDVIKTVREIAKLEKKVAEQPEITASEALPPDNPAFITLSSQLASTKSDIDSVKQQITDLEQKAGEYRFRIETSPRLEQEYNELLIERSTTNAKLNDLMRKVLEAKVAYGLEEDQKGERFTLIDPARLPEKPFKPNRKAIILIGIVLGIGAGIGMGALREFADNSVRKPENLTALTSFPVLAVIPEIVTQRDRRIRQIRRMVWVLAILVGIGAGIGGFHYMVMDLDIFRSNIVRKLDKYQVVPEYVMEMIRP